MPNNRIWKPNELNTIYNDLINNNLSIMDISKKYDRLPENIYNRLLLEKYDLSKIKYSNWTKEEENKLIELYNKLSWIDIKNIFNNKSLFDLKLKAKELNLGRKKQIKEHKKTPYMPPHNWTKEENDYLIKNFQLLSFEQMEEELNLTKKQIYTQAYKLKLSRNNIRIKSNSFTIYEIEILKTYYNNIPKKELLKLLPRKTEKQIERKAHELKIHKIHQTLPEDKTEQILKKLNIEYKKQVKFNFDFKYYLCDFELLNKKIIIEVQGDYWHGNPKIYNKNQLSDLQIDMINRDKEKKYLLEQLGYKVIYLWEYDLIYNYENCEQIIINCI